MILAYIDSKFKVPTGINGNQERPQATSNGNGHKKAPTSLGPFANLLLHTTDLAHRCKYARNRRERHFLFADDTLIQTQLREALKILLQQQRQAPSLRICPPLFNPTQYQMASSLSDRSPYQNKSFRNCNSGRQLHLQADALPATTRLSRRMLRRPPMAYTDPHQRNPHNFH